MGDVAKGQRQIVLGERDKDVCTIGMRLGPLDKHLDASKFCKVLSVDRQRADQGLSFHRFLLSRLREKE
ncbi:hypothetical protein D9M68_674550 [compost metagenome]